MNAMAAAGRVPLHLHQLKVAISQVASPSANLVPLIAGGMENFKFPSFAPSFIFNHFFLITAAREVKLLWSLLPAVGVNARLEPSFLQKSFSVRPWIAFSSRFQTELSFPSEAHPNCIIFLSFSNLKHLQQIADQLKVALLALERDLCRGARRRQPYYWLYHKSSGCR
jgi:hypothetical protein